MANIGLRNAKYNEIDYDTKKYKTLEDSKVPVIGRMIDAKLKEDKNDGSLFADDYEVESDNSFNGATLSITIDDVDDKTYTSLKGATLKENEVTENQNDIAPEIGYGHIVTKIYNGLKKYKVEFLPRIQITSITSDLKTKGEKTEYNTVVIEAKVRALDVDINGLKEGDWRKVQTFATLLEAKEYLDSLLTPIA